MAPKEKVVPVTILTGFLGAGKTTLLNHILKSQKQKMRFAIIENEFGEVGVDEKVITQATDEELIEVINGCICCTVRGDLSKALKKMYRRVQDFDAVIIETTGLADPSPVAQTFLMDDHIKKMYSLQGIVTVVDAKHILQHLEEKKPEGVENESVEQIAFADRILLNKTDLVPQEIRLERIEQKIRAINAEAPIIRCQQSKVDVKSLLTMKAFDIERILQMDPEFLNTDDHHNHHHHHHDHHHHHHHHHDASISSASCKFEGELNVNLLQSWIQEIIEELGQDLFRYKGVLAVKGMERKFVFQGVHMLFSGEFSDAKWKKGETRECRFVFIGRNLDKKELVDGFMRCKVEGELRFKVGDEVETIVPSGWKRARILKQWDQGNPYCMQLTDSRMRNIWGLTDTDDCVRRPIDPKSVKAKAKMTRTRTAMKRTGATKKKTKKKTTTTKVMKASMKKAATMKVMKASTKKNTNLGQGKRTVMKK